MLTSLCRSTVSFREWLNRFCEFLLIKINVKRYDLLTITDFKMDNVNTVNLLEN